MMENESRQNRVSDAAKKRRLVVRFAVSCVLALLWMALIFWMSANNADDSAAMSAGLSTQILNVLFGWADPAIVAAMDHTVRKIAHFTEYAILGALLANCAFSAVLLRDENACGGNAEHAATGNCTHAGTAEGLAANAIPAEDAGALSPKKCAVPLVCAWLFGALYAIGDEVHQSMVPGRSMQVSDMCLDAAGVLFGMVLFWIGWNAIRRRSFRRKLHR